MLKWEKSKLKWVFERKEHVPLLYKNCLCNPYTYREHWSHFIHAVTVSSLTYISDFLWVSRQFQLLVDELGECLHSICTAPNTHKLWKKKISDLCCLGFRILKTFFYVYINKGKHIYHLTNLNIPEHFREVVGLRAQAEVVQNILLHGVQIGIFHLDVLSTS